jgi:hypothetical protein
MKRIHAPTGVKLPVSTTVASVIDTVGEASCESPSQGCACRATGRSIVGNRTTLLSMRPVFMHRTISRHLSLERTMFLLSRTATRFSTPKMVSNFATAASSSNNLSCSSTPPASLSSIRLLMSFISIERSWLGCERHRRGLQIPIGIPSQWLYAFTPYRNSFVTQAIISKIDSIGETIPTL